jgi:heat shock protein HslJ
VERWGTEAPINAQLVASSAIGLEGIEWKLDEIDGEGMPEGRVRRPTLEFDAKAGRFSAMAGINQLSGTYVVSGNSLTLIPGPMTLMAGPKEDMDREQSFVRAMRRVTRFAIEAGKLELLTGESVGLLFSRD